MIELHLEALVPEIEYGTVIRWLKAAGDTLEAGEVILEEEAEKVVQEVALPVTAGADGDRGRGRRRAEASAPCSRSSRSAEGAPPPGPRLPTARVEALYRRMVMIRAFELRCMGLFGEKLIRGSVHPYIGMEAIAVGVCDVLRESDLITSTHRGHGHCIAKGLEPR